MKFFILQLHKWLGIVSGLVVFVVSITGAIFTFQDEIKDVLYDYRKIEVQEKPFLQPSEIYTIIQTQHPDMDVKRIMYLAKDRSTVVMLSDSNKEFFMSYINPYTGRELYIENFKDDFFITIQYLHTNLLLGKVGKQIVAISTIVFIILLISGLILWWPKKKQRKGAFRIKWGAKWKRVNYDLHNVIGFYSFFIALIIALSGLAFSYPELRNAYYTIGNLGQTNEKEMKKNILPTPEQSLENTDDLDKAYAYAKANSPTASMYWVYLPEPEKIPLTVRAYHKDMRYYAMDFYQFDAHQKVEKLMYDEISFGKKISNSVYDIHTGMILGTLGKIIAFLASLICASLPITGIIIWLNKKPKKKKK